MNDIPIIGQNDGDDGEEGAKQQMRAASLRDPRLAALLEHADEPFTWQTDLLTMMSMIAQVQLALRHPQNAGNESGRIAESFVRSVQQQLATFDVRLASLIEDGFDADSDVPMPAAGAELEDPSANAAAKLLGGALDQLAQAIDPLRQNQDQTLWPRVAGIGAALAGVLEELTESGTGRAES